MTTTGCTGIYAHTHTFFFYLLGKTNLFQVYQCYKAEIGTRLDSAVERRNCNPNREGADSEKHVGGSTAPRFLVEFHRRK